MLVFLLLATLASVTAVPIHFCPERETWYTCGACDAFCSQLIVSCPPVCRKGSCGCIEGHVREPKENRCVPQNECPRIGPNVVHPPVCPDKEKYFLCGACDKTCSGVEPKCPKACREGSCGCIEGHVRESKGRCIPEIECNAVEPAELRPVPAEIRIVPAEIHLRPAELHPPVPAEIRPAPEGVVPAEIRPQVCPYKEKWYPCGACDGSCSEQNPVCHKMCQQGSCGCMENHVREPRGHDCIHVMDCPNAVIPLHING